jgi:pyruvate formate lyase activating enzyme
MSRKGMVFNIQRFSIHDGPGIRTAVFLKGCPLHCPWCSNPESQSKDIQLTWDRKKCISCGACTSACNFDSIHMIEAEDLGQEASSKKIIMIDGNKCTTCMMCKNACLKGAIAYEGYYRTVDEVMDIVMKDEPFYLESGGGITLTGGEVLSQPEFAAELLKTAKLKGLHTTIETTCFGPKEKFMALLSHLDLLLCDIKHWNSEKHEKVTGVPLGQIYDNIRSAIQIPGLDIIGRIPVIPGFNYTINDAEKMSEAIIGLGISKVHLLRYHSFGENKYELLNREYLMKGTDSIQKDDPFFIEYADVYRRSGLQVL